MENRTFKTSAKEILRGTNIEEALSESFNKLHAEREAYTGKGSGFSLKHIDGILLDVYNYSPLGGSTYIELPREY